MPLLKFRVYFSRVGYLLAVVHLRTTISLQCEKQLFTKQHRLTKFLSPWTKATPGTSLWLEVNFLRGQSKDDRFLKMRADHAAVTWWKCVISKTVFVPPPLLEWSPHWISGFSQEFLFNSWPFKPFKMFCSWHSLLDVSLKRVVFNGEITSIENRRRYAGTFCVFF